jgi:hypothetical protein
VSRPTPTFDTDMIAFVASALLVLCCGVESRIINGAKVGSNVCSGWTEKCNTAAGWGAWCDNQWDHHCCFREGPPAQETCTEVEPCHYVCCSWPDKPCGYKCCTPSGEAVFELPSAAAAHIKSDGGEHAPVVVPMMSMDDERVPEAWNMTRGRVTAVTQEDKGETMAPVDALAIDTIDCVYEDKHYSPGASICVADPPGQDHYRRVLVCMAFCAGYPGACWRKTYGC